MTSEHETKPPTKSFFDAVTQFLLPTFTLGGILLTSLKLPQWGLVSNLVAQVFWLYSGWQSWKKANQIGIFVNAIAFTVIVIFGIVNYWFL